MEVVGIRSLARRQLPQAAADELTAQLVADSRSLAAKAIWPFALLELRSVDVWHEREPTRAAGLCTAGAIPERRASRASAETLGVRPSGCLANLWPHASFHAEQK